MYKFCVPCASVLLRVSISKNIKKKYKIFTIATHCVFIHVQYIPLSKNSSYTVGIFVGGTIPVLIIATMNDIPDYLLSKSFYSYAHTTTCINTLEKKIPLFIKNEVHHIADKNLFNVGVRMLCISFRKIKFSVDQWFMETYIDRKDRLGLSARGYAKLFKKHALLHTFKSVVQ